MSAKTAIERSSKTKQICNRLLFEELEKVQNYCSRIEGETINKSKLNFMFVLRDVLSSLGECQYGISGGTAIVILIALYFVIKWAVKNGIKEAYSAITGKKTDEDIQNEKELKELGLDSEDQ